MKIMLQLLAYALFAVTIGALSSMPSVRLLAMDSALVSVTFSHASARIGECKRLTQEELLALPPNMRMPDQCPRERHALRIEFMMDGEYLLRDTVKPSGLWSDGKSTIYRRFEIPAGRHRFDIRMNDSGIPDVFDHVMTRELAVSPARNLVVFFDEATSAFVFE